MTFMEEDDQEQTTLGCIEPSPEGSGVYDTVSFELGGGVGTKNETYRIVFLHETEARNLIAGLTAAMNINARRRAESVRN